jgi:predicted RNA-binding protein YlqC (UPF0109 family)/uncharacterized HAD superfamily protein
LIDQRKLLTVMDVKVDQQKIEKIIGKYRQNRRAIEEETGAEIFVVGEKGKQIIRFRGGKDNIMKAKARVEEMAEKVVIYEMKVELANIGKVIGKSGENIRAIHDESGAKIDIIEKDEAKLVRIIGYEESVQAAKESIQEIIERNTKVSFDMKVESQDVGRLIGKAGENIRAMCEKSGAKITIITEGENNLIRIMGSKESVKAAKKIIQEILDDWVTSKVKESLPYSALRTLGFETGTRMWMEIDERDCHFIKISGTREKVENAQKCVKKYVARLVTIEMIVNKETAKELLANSGQTIKCLQYLTGALITVKDGRLVQIVGLNEQTLEAKKKVQEIGHHTNLTKANSIGISNKEAKILKGMVINEIENETGANAFFSKRGHNVQNIVFNGDQLKVEDAANEVLDILDELSGQNIVWVPHDLVEKYFIFLRDMGLTVEVLDKRGKGKKKFQIPLKISGTKKDLKEAKSKLKDTMKDIETRNLLGLKNQTIEAKMNVQDTESDTKFKKFGHSKKKANVLKGTEIIGVDNETETFSLFPKSKPHIKNIPLSGEQFQVKEAADEVLKTLDELSGQNIVWTPQGSLGKYVHFLKGVGLKVDVLEERRKGTQKFKIPLQISGTKNNLEVSKRKLHGILSETENKVNICTEQEVDNYQTDMMKTVEIIVPSHLVGPKILKQLRRGSKAEVMAVGSRKIVINGSAKEISLVKKRVEDLLADGSDSE